MAVDTSTFLPDMKFVYGAIQDQVSTFPAVMNLFGDGSKFGKPINNLGVRGYVGLARMGPNWNMGFRPEGTVGVGLAGNQNLQNFTVVLKYFYVPVLITGQAENLSKGESRAFMQAKALEAKFDMKDSISHLNVIAVGADRGGQLALVSASGAGSITCTAAGGATEGTGALYIRVGQIIDCGPVGGGPLSIQGATVTAVTYTGSGTITHTGGTATVGHGVFLSGECPTTAAQFPLTCEGLISLVSSSGAIEGLNPATVNQQAWASFQFDNSNTALSSQTFQTLRQFTKNRGGLDVDIYIAPSAQINQLVTIATSTINYRVNMGDYAPKTDAQKKAIDLGFDVYNYAGQLIVEDKDGRPDRLWALATEGFKKFEAIPLSMAEDEAGTWTRVSGTNGIADAVQGLLRWYINLGTIQRSAGGICTGLAVPTQFTSNPPTL